MWILRSEHVKVEISLIIVSFVLTFATVWYCWKKRVCPCTGTQSRAWRKLLNRILKPNKDKRRREFLMKAKEKDGLGGQQMVVHSKTQEPIRPFDLVSVNEQDRWLGFHYIKAPPAATSNQQSQTEHQIDAGKMRLTITFSLESFLLICIRRLSGVDIIDNQKHHHDKNEGQSSNLPKRIDKDRLSNLPVFVVTVSTLPKRRYKATTKLHTLGPDGCVTFGEAFKFKSICRDSLMTSEVRFRVYQQTYSTLQSFVGEVNILFSDIVERRGTFTVVEPLKKISKIQQKYTSE